MSSSGYFCLCLKALHLRRMIVTDSDLRTLVKGRGHMLQVLKLEKCSGFSTLGLAEVARGCRSLKVLLLEESCIEDNGQDWLHELALHNSSLEVLNFYMTGLDKINVSDLELIVTNCASLSSLKVSECDILDLRGILKKATALEEFGGGSFSGSEDRAVRFPPKLTSLLGLCFMSETELPAILPIASTLKKLDLQYTFLSTENHCQLVGLCTNLLVAKISPSDPQGCPKLERLEIRGCCFSESALAAAVLRLKALKYIWVQGYNATVSGANLLAMARPFWNIEFSPGLQLPRDVVAEDVEAEEINKQAAQILAYYSLAGRRTDHPDSVIPLTPPNWNCQQVAGY